MPRKRRALKSRLKLYHDHVACLRWCQLGCGIDWRHDEFGEGKEFDGRTARGEWSRVREEFLARWRKKTCHGNARPRSYGAKSTSTV